MRKTNEKILFGYERVDVIQDASWFLIEFFEEVLPVFLLFLRVTPA
jgi:hypothetical protein